MYRVSQKTSVLKNGHNSYLNAAIKTIKTIFENSWKELSLKRKNLMIPCKIDWEIAFKVSKLTYKILKN